MTGGPIDIGTTRGSDEREARSLSAPILRFELSAESARLRAERQYIEGDRNACTLTKVDWFRLVLVALHAGATLDEAEAVDDSLLLHLAWPPAPGSSVTP